jgi:hypothetical protein
MPTKEFPRIGMLGIMQEFYGEMIPRITEHQAEFSRELCAPLAPAAEVVFTRPALALVQMPYFHFRPDSGMRPFLTSWLRNGGTHHFCLNLGDLSNAGGSSPSCSASTTARTDRRRRR